VALHRHTPQGREARAYLRMQHRHGLAEFPGAGGRAEPPDQELKLRHLIVCQGRPICAGILLPRQDKRRVVIIPGGSGGGAFGHHDGPTHLLEWWSLDVAGRRERHERKRVHGAKWWWSTHTLPPGHHCGEVGCTGYLG
jgi:hypothetical protein